MKAFARRLLLAMLTLSLGARWLAGADPLIARYHGHWLFPAWRFYPASLFDDESGLRPDYRALAAEGKIRAWFPPIPYGPNDSDATLSTPPPTAPDHRHWLGTDDRGRDVGVRLLYGLRTSFAFAGLAWFLSAVFGYGFGLWQGLRGGRSDLFGQRLIEIWSVIPPLHVLLFALCILRPSLLLLTAIWILFGWMPFAAYARGEALRVREEPYLEAARAAGIGGYRLFFRHLLPHTLTPLRALTPIVIGANIAALAGLDYLGLGLPPPTPSWGELLRQGRENWQCGWLLWSPLVALAVLMILLAVAGDSRETQ